MHNAATLEYARRRLEFVTSKLNPESSWHATLTEATRLARESDSVRRGSLKSWIDEGRELETLQLDVKLSDAEPAGIANVWVPSARLVDGVAATYFTLNGSRRDFAGVTTLLASDSIYVGFDGKGDDRVGLIIYRVLS